MIYKYSIIYMLVERTALDLCFLIVQSNNKAIFLSYFPSIVQALFSLGSGIHLIVTAVKLALDLNFQPW